MASWWLDEAMDSLVAASAVVEASREDMVRVLDRGAELLVSRLPRDDSPAAVLSRGSGLVTETRRALGLVRSQITKRLDDIDHQIGEERALVSAASRSQAGASAQPASHSGAAVATGPAVISHPDRGRLRDAVRTLQAEALAGVEALRRLAHDFGAVHPPEASPIVFHGSSEQREALIPYRSQRLDRPDPEEAVVFWTPSSESAAFCALFNAHRREQWTAAGLLDTTSWRRADFPKAWVPNLLEIEAPADVLDAVHATPADQAMIVTPEMWQAAVATRPEGVVHVTLVAPPIRPAGRVGDHYTCAVPHRAMVAVPVTFDEIESSIVVAEKGSVRFNWRKD